MSDENLWCYISRSFCFINLFFFA